MKYFLKGIGLGLSLNIAHLFCSNLDYDVLEPSSLIIFFIVTTAFLISDTVPNLLLCGFTGLFVMFFSELFIFDPIFDVLDFDVYFCGMFGSLAAIVISILITIKQIRFQIKEGVIMSKELKNKLILYAIITSISFSYLTRYLMSLTLTYIFAVCLAHLPQL